MVTNILTRSTRRFRELAGTSPALRRSGRHRARRPATARMSWGPSARPRLPCVEGGRAARSADRCAPERQRSAPTPLNISFEVVDLERVKCRSRRRRSILLDRPGPQPGAPRCPTPPAGRRPQPYVAAHADRLATRASRCPHLGSPNHTSHVAVSSGAGDQAVTAATSSAALRVTPWRTTGDR